MDPTDCFVVSFAVIMSSASAESCNHKMILYIVIYSNHHAAELRTFPLQLIEMGILQTFLL